jgi:hypothetical protein
MGGVGAMHPVPGDSRGIESPEEMRRDASGDSSALDTCVSRTLEDIGRCLIFFKHGHDAAENVKLVTPQTLTVQRRSSAQRFGGRAVSELRVDA